VKLKLSIAALVLVATIVVLAYMAGAEFRDRRAILEPLRSSRASLSEVEVRSGKFTITRRDTPDWASMVARYQAGSDWDRHIATKMERASAVGHNSTISMQTWIFLDEADRLIDFELGSQ
jgi:hypothetical protein